MCIATGGCGRLESESSADRPHLGHLAKHEHAVAGAVQFGQNAIEQLHLAARAHERVVILRVGRGADAASRVADVYDEESRMKHGCK